MGKKHTYLGKLGGKLVKVTVEDGKGKMEGPIKNFSKTLVKDRDSGKDR